MHFSEIELYNFGIYKGQHNIELIDQRKKKNITLVGGMNGRGKTTILDAIFLCLYGRKAIEYIVGKKEAYNKVLKDRINKSADDKTTHVKITMVMDDDEDTVISITRAWSQTDSKISTNLIVEKNGIEDTYLSENWEYYVEELIPYGIAKFFFFDAEKIVSFAEINTPEQRKELSKAYSQVLGIHKYDELKRELEKIQDEYRKESAQPEDKAKFIEISANIEKAETALSDIDQQVIRLQDEKVQKDYDFQQLQEKLVREGDLMSLERLHELEAKREKQQAEMNDAQEGLKDLYNYIPFGLAGGIVAELATQLKEEKAYKQNKLQLEGVEEKTEEILNDLDQARNKFDGIIERKIRIFYE